MNNTVSLIKEISALSGTFGDQKPPAYNAAIADCIAILRQHEFQQSADNLYHDSIIQDIDKSKPPVYLSKGELEFSTAFRLVAAGSYVIIGREGDASTRKDEVSIGSEKPDILPSPTKESAEADSGGVRFDAHQSEQRAAQRDDNPPPSSSQTLIGKLPTHGNYAEWTAEEAEAVMQKLYPSEITVIDEKKILELLARAESKTHLGNEDNWENDIDEVRPLFEAIKPYLKVSPKRESGKVSLSLQKDAIDAAYKAAVDWIKVTFPNGEEKIPHYPMISLAVQAYLCSATSVPKDVETDKRSYITLNDEKGTFHLYGNVNAAERFIEWRKGRIVRKNVPCPEITINLLDYAIWHNTKLDDLTHLERVLVRDKQDKVEAEATWNAIEWQFYIGDGVIHPSNVNYRRIFTEGVIERAAINFLSVLKNDLNAIISSKINHYDMTLVTDFPDGTSLYIQENEIGGYTYYSDEIGCGVMVWDTALVSEKTLLAAIKHSKGESSQEQKKYGNDEIISLLQDAKEYLLKAKCTAWNGIKLNGDDGDHDDCKVCKGSGYIIEPDKAISIINNLITQIEDGGSNASKE